MSKDYQIDMTKGSVFGVLLQFSIPLICSSVLQLLFNAADVIVVGRFAGDNSLAAVGSTTALINLLVNLFVGLSVGTTVVAANFFGSNRNDDLSQTVHTAILISFIGGIILSVVGVVFSKQILLLIKAPEEVLDLATTYLKIYFAGITPTIVYNFGCALLRAKGDTKRPLYVLLFAGLVNVVLNLIFVIVFKMNVAGVAIATVISQIVAATFIIKFLCSEKSSFKLVFSKLRINIPIFIKIVKIGVPAGFQGIIFSLSNVIIQSAINSFGANIVAANSAAALFL
jgi:putative MATE family efflux protein